MFGIPEQHINALVASGKYPDARLSLIEECGELISALAKWEGNEWEYNTNLEHVAEEMAHVLVSMNMLARTFNISLSDIQLEVERKGIKAGFKTGEYDWINA